MTTIACHHEYVVLDDGATIPTCDICDGPQWVEGDDWNGETGNHRSCEERHPAEVYGTPEHEAILIEEERGR